MCMMCEEPRIGTGTQGKKKARAVCLYGVRERGRERQGPTFRHAKEGGQARVSREKGVDECALDTRTSEQEISTRNGRGKA